MTARKLLFVSPRFLFPATTGGQIRTSQILRGMRGNAFEITLLSPATPAKVQKFGEELDGACDHFAYWPEARRNFIFPFKRAYYSLSQLPIPIATDQSAPGKALVREHLGQQPSLVVFDFPHSAVLSPAALKTPSVMFTHNVEADIFKRHMQVAQNPLKKSMWRNQYRKMVNFEQHTLNRFNRVVAVSERDATLFREDYGIRNVAVVRTGVDLSFFDYRPPRDENKVVFIGSMDWLANIDGIEYFMDRIWPGVMTEVPGAFMKVIGRNPPSHLIQRVRSKNLNWEFTGFVDDIRKHVDGASVCVIPLRVAGGTRIKAYESMAMGCPVVSTSVGMEGLPVQPGEHYLRADSPEAFAASVVKMLRDRAGAQRFSRNARSYVENNFSFEEAAREFEDICLDTLTHY